MYKAVSGFCGTDAGDVTIKILLKFFQLQLKGCDKVYPRCQEHGYTDTPDIRKVHNPYAPDDLGPRTPNRRFYGSYPQPRETESEDRWTNHPTVDWKKCKSNGNSRYGTSGTLNFSSVFLLQMIVYMRRNWFH